MSYCKFVIASLGIALAAATFACQGDARQKSDAELGLTAEQAGGRRVYEAHCQSCHEPYSSGGRYGPCRRGVVRKPYLPSGFPANNARVNVVWDPPWTPHRISPEGRQKLGIEEADLPPTA